MSITINWTQVDASLQSLAGLVAEVAPVASLAGPAGAAAVGVISTGITVAENVIALATASGSAAPAGTLASLQASYAAIQGVNDGLAEQVAAS